MTETGWRNAQLGDLLRIKHGFAFKGEYFSTGGEYVLLTPGNFRADGGLKLGEVDLRFYDGPVPDGFVLKPGSLVVVLTDLKQDAPILGAPGFVPEGLALLHNQRLGLVEWVDGAEADARFIYYFMNSTPYREAVRASATGSTVRHTAPERIAAVKVRLPPPGTQRRIGELLASFDELIENNRRRLEILEETARALYREWFVRFRFPGHESAVLVDSPAGAVPSGWAVRPAGEVMQVVGGGTPKRADAALWSDATIRWYTPSDLTRSNSLVALPPKEGINELGLKRSSARLFPAGTVMLTSRATIGYSAISPTDACTNQGFINCMESDDFDRYQILFWMRENVELFARSASGATFKELSKGVFKTLPVAVPDRELGAAFRARVSELVDLCSCLEAQNRNLSEGRDALLPRFVTGQIDADSLGINDVFGWAELVEGAQPAAVAAG